MIQIGCSTSDPLRVARMAGDPKPKSAAKRGKISDLSPDVHVEMKTVNAPRASWPRGPRRSVDVFEMSAISSVPAPRPDKGETPANRPPLPALAADSGAPFDMIVDQVDRDNNNLPLNPRWRGIPDGSGAITDPVTSDGPCATAVDEEGTPDGDQDWPGDMRPLINGDCTHTAWHWSSSSGWEGCDGHIVIDESVGFTGHLFWSDLDDSALEFDDDDDYNLDLVICDVKSATECRQDQGAGVNARGARTVGGGRALHLEFDSDETVDEWDDTWWGDEFHNAVDDSNATASELVDDKLTIAYGKWGMDCFHYCKAELHPVLGMAVRTVSFPSLSFPDLLRGEIVFGTIDIWQVFYRSEGNMGACGFDPNEVFLQEDLKTAALRWLEVPMTFRFPAPKGQFGRWWAISGKRKHFDDNPTTSDVTFDEQTSDAILTIDEHYYNAWWASTVAVFWEL